MRALLLLLIAQPFAQPSFNLNSPVPLSRIVCDGGVVCWRDAGTITIIGTSTGGAPSSSDFDGGYNRVQDEGVDLTKRLTVDFTGAGVTCTDTGAKTSCSIPGGGAGSANVVEVDVDFGTQATVASTVVTGQAWVTGTSKILCVPTMLATASRSEGDEDAVIEQLIPATHSRVAGVGFTLTVAAPLMTNGVFKFHCTGA